MNKLSKIVATDLDGTLFNANSEISTRNLAALKLASESGYHTVAVTGRSWRTATERLKPAAGIDYVICSNGAYLYRQSHSAVSWENMFTTNEVTELITAIRKWIPDACFAWESRTGLFFEPEFLRLATNPQSLEQGGTAGEAGSQRVYKLFIRAPRWTHHELLLQLEPKLKHLATISSSGAPFLEATSPGTDKASALARLAGDLNIAAENVIAFGDNLNDLPMLKWAGSSVAMANALPEVKRIASNCTSSNIDHGVAQYLETLLGSAQPIS